MEQTDPFNFIVVKRNCFAVTIGEFYDIIDIILMLIVITLNLVNNKISLKTFVAGQFIFLVFCAWNLVFRNAWSMSL